MRDRHPLGLARPPCGLTKQATAGHRPVFHGPRCCVRSHTGTRSAVRDHDRWKAPSGLAQPQPAMGDGSVRTSASILIEGQSDHGRVRGSSKEHERPVLSVAVSYSPPCGAHAAPERRQPGETAGFEANVDWQDVQHGASVLLQRALRSPSSATLSRNLGDTTGRMRRRQDDD